MFRYALLPCPYINCKRRCHSEEMLNDHILKQHTFKNRFKCNLCSYTAAYTSTIKVHHIQVHSPHAYRCSDCDYTSARKGTLQRHIKSIHMGIRYPCPFCNAIFCSTQYLRKHVHKKHTEMCKEYLKTHCTQTIPSSMLSTPGIETVVS